MFAFVLNSNLILTAVFTPLSMFIYGLRYLYTFAHILIYVHAYIRISTVVVIWIYLCICIHMYIRVKQLRYLLENGLEGLDGVLFLDDRDERAQS